MATVALGIVLDNAVMALFGKEPRALISVLADEPIPLGGIGVYPLQLLIPVVALAVAVELHLVMKRTPLGLRLQAAVQNSAAARLMGIDVGRMVAGTYAAAGFVLV